MFIARFFVCLIFIVTALGCFAQRSVVLFNDGWQFLKGPLPQVDVSSAEIDSDWKDVSLPHTWNAEDMQTRVNDFYQGACLYRKDFTYAGVGDSLRYFLRFEGVGSCAEVFLNGRLVAVRKGAYSAFVAEITGALRSGVNRLVVKADNTARPDVIPVNHQLFGVYGGIYRDVSLVVVPRQCIVVDDSASPGVYVSQENVSEASADVSVKVKLDNSDSHPSMVKLSTIIVDYDGNEVCRRERDLKLQPQGVTQVVERFALASPRLWNGIADPYLYGVRVELQKDARVIDRVVQPLGLRSYEVRPGDGFFLNGRRYPMYGVTRHQDWWGLGSALTKKEHDADLDAIMDIGATTVRLAHYQQADYVYSRCDTLGLVVWAEIPFVNRVTGQEWENCHSQLRELIRQNFNHPSIYVWGLHNEVYSPVDYTASLTASLNDLAKTEDPGRLTASVNGYGVARHPVNHRADIQGMNRYFGWYERKISDIEAWVEGLEREFPWQSLMLTEYGADANMDHQTELLGESLDWSKPYYPETFQTKTHEYQWGVIADHPYIAASYLWNMFDFACPMWSRGGVDCRNLKGLMSFDRTQYKDSYFWYKANWSSRPVLYLTQRRNKDRERKVTSVTVYSNRGVPELEINGRKAGLPRRGYTDVHWIFDGIELSEGENRIVARVCDGKTNLVDEIVWNYSGDKDRSPEAFESKKEHVGF